MTKKKKRQMSQPSSGRARRRTGRLETGQHHIGPWEGDRTNPLTSHIQAHEGQEVDWQHEFTEDKIYPSTLNASCDVVTVSVDEE